jgi:hypothetical protein
VNFIESLLAMTSEAETPESFIKWAGLSAISAVVKRNVWLDKYDWKVYPNIYTLLIADSGMAKGLATSLAGKLVRAVAVTKVIGGQNSIQGIVTEMAKFATSENGGPPKLNSQAFLCSNELITMLLEDKQAIPILTELYDTHYNDMWEKTLKGSGIEKLKEPSITLLAASNEEFLREALPQSAYKGGFMGRTFVVIEKKKRSINARTRAPKVRINLSTLVPHLTALSKLSGEFHYADESTILRYEKWYEEFNSQKVIDNTGARERAGDHVTKLAMLLALSETAELQLQFHHIDQAIDLVESLIFSKKRLGVAKGKSEFAQKVKVVLDDLIESGSVERTVLLRAHYGEFSAVELDNIIDTLVQSKAVSIEKRGGQSYYVIKQEIRAHYAKLEEGKK